MPIIGYFSLLGLVLVCVATVGILAELTEYIRLLLMRASLRHIGKPYWYWVFLFVSTEGELTAFDEALDRVMQTDVEEEGLS